METRAELIEPQNLSPDKRFPNDLVCFAVFLSAKLTSDDSVIQLPKTVYEQGIPAYFLMNLPVIKTSGCLGATSELTIM